MAHLQQFPKSFSWTTLLALLSALFLLVHLPKHVASSSSDFSSGSNSSSGSPTVIRTEPSSSGSGFGGSYGSGSGGGNRLSSASSQAGHKYRSSFYYPKYKQRRASTTLATPSAAALTQGPAASSSAAGPVYVVWSRQNGGGAGAAADQEYGAASDTSAIASAAGTSGAVTSYQDLENYYHYDLHSPSMDTKFSEYYQSYPYHHGHGGYESAPYEEPPAAYVGKPKYMPDEDESSRESSSGSRFRDEDEDVDRGRDGRKRGRDRDRDGRPEHRSERERGEYRRDRDRRNEDEYLDEEHDSYDEKPKASKKSSSKALAKHNKNRRTGFDHLRGGLLSLKGLKLSAIGFFYLFRGLLILLWKFLPWIFLVIVMFLFIPIPIITIPATAGRGVMASVNTTEITNAMTSLARKVVDSEECVERISCEVRERSGRESWIPAAVKFLLYNYGPQLPPTVSRMAKAFVQNRPCKYVKCDMVSQALE